MNRTRFTQGNGALTAADLNRFRDATRDYERFAPSAGAAARIAETSGVVRPYFFAKITGHATFGSYTWRWLYSFEEMGWEPADDGFVSITGGIVGSENAYNMNEAFNANASTVLAPGYTVANIPTGFDYQPISTGTVVVMHIHVAQDGQQVFMFCAQNAIDGVCA